MLQFRTRSDAMMKLLRINDAKSARVKDINGYLIIKDNPIAKAGVFDYLKKEVEDNGDDSIVKVCRPFEDLEAKKDKFAKMPIVFGHQWVGEAVDSVAGAIGDEVRAEYPYLYADLIIYSQELIKAIEEDKVVELSPAYNLSIIKEEGIYKGESYSYKQDLAHVNHLAVVPEGRSGKDLRLLDEKIKGEKEMDILDLLTKSIKRIKDENPVKEDEKKAQDEDKRELIREVMAIASKPDSDFAGGENEKIDAITKLLEKLAYNPSETSKEVDSPAKDEEVKSEVVPEVKEDNSAKIENVEEFLKGIERLMDAKIEALKSQETRLQDERAKAYQEVSQLVGSFNTDGLSASDIYAQGYKYLTNRALDSGIDAKSAFKIKAQDMRPVFKAEDNKPDSGLTKEQEAMLARLG